MTITEFLVRLAEYWIVLAGTGQRGRYDDTQKMQNIAYVLIALWNARKAIATDKHKPLEYFPDQNALRIESKALRNVVGDDSSLPRPFKLFYRGEPFARRIRQFATSDEYRQWRNHEPPVLKRAKALIDVLAAEGIPFEKSPNYRATLVQSPASDSLTVIGFKNLSVSEALEFGKTGAHSDFPGILDASAKPSASPSQAYARVEAAPSEHAPMWAVAADHRYHFAASINNFPERFTPMMRDLLRERFSATPDGDTDRMHARIGDEEGAWLATYLPPDADTSAWREAVDSSLATAKADFVLVFAAESYADARSSIASVAEGLPPVRILDPAGALAWCGPVPWVWSKEYGTTSSAHVIKPGDEEHLRRVLGANGKPGAPAWDGATSRRVVASSHGALADEVLGVLQPYSSRVIIVLHHGIGQDVLRIAQGFGDVLARKGHEEFIVALLNPAPRQAEEKAGMLLNVMRWITDRTPSVRVHGLIAHTPAAPFDDAQAWLEDHGFQAPIML